MPSPPWPTPSSSTALCVTLNPVKSLGPLCPHPVSRPPAPPTFPLRSIGITLPAQLWDIVQGKARGWVSLWNLLEMQTLGPHSRASESNFAFSQEPQVTVVNIKLRSPASNDLQKCTQLWAPIIPNLESLTVYDSIFSKQSQTDHTSVTHTVLNANFIL